MPVLWLSERWWWTRAGSHYQEKGHRGDKLRRTGDEWTSARRKYINNQIFFIIILRGIKTDWQRGWRGATVWGPTSNRTGESYCLKERMRGWERESNFGFSASRVDGGYRKCLRGYTETRHGGKINESDSLCCLIPCKSFVCLITQSLQPMERSFLGLLYS